MFDGSDMARVALTSVLQRLGRIDALVGTWTVEQDPRLLHAAREVALAITQGHAGPVHAAAADTGPDLGANGGGVFMSLSPPG